MSNSRTVIALAAILILGVLVGYLAWSNHQKEIRDFRPFKPRLHIEQSSRLQIYTVFYTSITER